jgi:hypothetical protein
MSELVKELIEFFADLASGQMKIEDARKHAKKFRDKLAETATDDLLAEMDARIAELEASPPDASDR